MTARLGNGIRPQIQRPYFQIGRRRSYTWGTRFDRPPTFRIQGQDYEQEQEGEEKQGLGAQQELGLLSPPPVAVEQEHHDSVRAGWLASRLPVLEAVGVVEAAEVAAEVAGR